MEVWEISDRKGCNWSKILDTMKAMMREIGNQIESYNLKRWWENHVRQVEDEIWLIKVVFILFLSIKYFYFRDTGRKERIREYGNEKIQRNLIYLKRSYFE